MRAKLGKAWLQNGNCCYFNVFTEYRLGPLPHKETAALLAQAGKRFSGRDRTFIVEVSGRHPYLL